MDVYSRSGRIYLGKRLGSGGEAEVYEVNGSARAAKIYRDTLSAADLQQKRRKIDAMIALTPADPGARIGHVSLAWPVELLFDGHRKFCGYLMPRAESLGTLTIVSNPKGRQLASIDFDWRYLHRTASNLALSVSAVHRIGHCIGDFNPGNVLVTNRALVTLIDTDSFQIIDGKGTRFGCGVGIDQYLAPERVRGGTVTPEQDAFVLAVLVFQILMGGFHPFDGGAIIAAHSTAQLPLAQYLKQGIFPFISNGQAQPPDGAPDFALLRRELRDAFQKTFITGHRNPLLRVQAGEWMDLLARAEADLVRCSREKDHLYYQSVGTCIWCEQKGRTRAQVPLPAPPPVQRPRAATPGPFAPAPAPARTQRAGSAVARNLDFRYVAVVALIVLLGGISSRARFREEVATHTAAVDTSMTVGTDTMMTDTMATDTMATDTMSTDTMSTDTMSTSATDTTATAPADPLIAFGVTTNDVRLFASPSSDLPAATQRKFATTFPRAETTNLGWQLELKIPTRPSARQNFTVDARFLDSQGSVIMAIQQLETWLVPEWPASWHAKNGVNPSSWPAGRYLLEVGVNGRVLAVKTFDLVDPPSGFANVNARVTELKLFVSGEVKTPLTERRYTDRFDTATLRWLAWELSLTHPAPNTRVPFQLEAVVVSGGQVIARETYEFNVSGTWVSSYHDAMFNAWSWKDGSYTLFLIADGKVIVTKDFVLE